ncbi:hypothetical protein GCM10022223_58920 [Kineosporia mesophila]|uniref:Uncharacterized protein n=1 Tax=Kineosporia mesophila TaxID=566012 RepID=A0ABP7AIU7_9ACTN|nr:hypothetical protein [Kineosporia mesophila]MCD5350748.1 hypothetical protein [Kineosporia mesophila]
MPASLGVGQYRGDQGLTASRAGRASLGAISAGQGAAGVLAGTVRLMSVDRPRRDLDPWMRRLLWFSAIAGCLGLALVALDDFLSGALVTGSLRVVAAICMGLVFRSILRRSKGDDGP